MSRHKHIYNTSQWQRLRAAKLRMDPLCEYCPPERRCIATEVDHYRAISDGCDPYDMNNLRSACSRCHSSKTANGERLIGCDVNGIPIDPAHLWRV